MMAQQPFPSGDGLTRKPGHVFADELVVGMRIIPPGKKRPVTIERQFSDPGSASYFEFACSSPQGWSALVLHRSDQVQVVPRKSHASRTAR